MYFHILSGGSQAASKAEQAGDKAAGKAADTADNAADKAAEAVNENTGARLSGGDVKQQVQQTIEKVRDPNTPMLDAVPDDLLEKVTDMLSDTLGNGRL